MGINERKQREKLQRNDQILEAARSLFIEKGFKATTMQDIADRAELGRRTLYMYFKTKDEIVTAIALDITSVLCQVAARASREGDSGRERLLNLANSFVSYYRSRPRDFMLVLTVDYRGASETRDGESITDLVTTLTDLLSEILEIGFADGSLRASGASTTLTARTIVSSILGTLRTLSLSSEQENDMEALLVHLIELITNSLIPPMED